MSWPDFSQFGRVTSDLVTGMSVTQFTMVGHIAMSLHFYWDHFEVDWENDIQVFGVVLVVRILLFIGNP